MAREKTSPTWCFPEEDLGYGYKGRAGKMDVEKLKMLAANNPYSGPVMLRDWPARLEYLKLDGQVCWICGKQHNLWMTTSDVWELLPPNLRGFRMCTDCYRFACWFRGKAPRSFKPPTEHLLRMSAALMGINAMRGDAYGKWVKTQPKEK